MSITVASLHIYPIKSIGGFSVTQATLTDRGFEHDRRWMLVDERGRFLSQRELPTMACLHTTPGSTGMVVTDTRTSEELELPWSTHGGAMVSGKVWDDEVELIEHSTEASAWFSRRLGHACRLMYMPDGSKRAVDPTYARGITSLSDGFPYLVLSQATLDDLNARLELPVPMDRFRPNVVIAGGFAFQEDGWTEIRVGAVDLRLVKPCGRCMIVTTDQNSGERSKEPLRTLATYRSRGAKVLFGMNAMGPAQGTIRVGDPVQVIRPSSA